MPHKEFNHPFDNCKSWQEFFKNHPQVFEIGMQRASEDSFKIGILYPDTDKYQFLRELARGSQLRICLEHLTK